MSSEVYLDKTPIRTGELTERVLHHYGCANEVYRGGQQKYVGMTQLRTDAGWDVTTADVVVMGAWKSSGHLVEGFEVKISRSDWLNEVKKPNKNDIIRQYCNKFWLVIADANMVKEGELPDNWGMMVASGTGLKIIKKAPLLDPLPLTNGFVAMMMRCNQSATIPADVASDRVKDAERKYSAEYKAKYSGLVEYIKLLNKELGINIEHDNYQKKWYAKVNNWELVRQVTNNGSYLNPEELAAVIKIVLTGDLAALKWRLESATNAAEDILKIAKEFKEAQNA